METKTKIKKINGFEDYVITSTGEVISTKNNAFKMLRPNYHQKGGTGYLKVFLYKDGKRYVRFIHRLVTEHFIGEYKYLQVNHKDFDKQNNNLDNLEWVTAQQNSDHYWINKGRI